MTTRIRSLIVGADGQRGRAIIEVGPGHDLLVRPDEPGTRLPDLPGVVTSRFTDAHVHLALVDPAPLASSVMGSVVDLGADPSTIQGLATTGITGSGPALRVRYAGAFLTPPGGYPSDRDWAPAGSVREIGDVDAAVTAVADMAAAGATLIKVADNAVAGPVFDDDTFRAIVASAAGHRLPVVAHAEGAGEVLRAAGLGARLLAHAPFDEVLSDDEAAVLAGTVTCISTLDIHGWGEHGRAYEIAVENVRRIHTAGGRIRYGTDMGNGPTPVGLNVRELAALAAAGLDQPAVLRALDPGDLHDPAAGLVLLSPGDEHEYDLATARLLTADDIQEQI